MPLTAGRDSGASGPGEMGQGSLPTSNGRTPCWGIRFLSRRRPHPDALGSLHVRVAVRRDENPRPDEGDGAGAVSRVHR